MTSTPVTVGGVAVYALPYLEPSTSTSADQKSVSAIAFARDAVTTSQGWTMVIAGVGVRPAIGFGPRCIQPSRDERSIGYFGTEPESEDCLTLNVWTPSTRGRAPVRALGQGDFGRAVARCPPAPHGEGAL